MPKILGVDIAGLVHQHLSPKLLETKLRREIKGPREKGNLTEGQRTRTVTYDCAGFVDAFTTDEQQLVGITVAKIVLIGNSLPTGIIPQSDDEILIEGKVFTVLGVPSRDPAGATYVCQGQR